MRHIFWGRLQVIAALALALLLAGCDKAPVTLGFLGGLTGPAADLGTGGRDGALLAVEQVNQQGGVHGSSVKLHEFDDQQQPGTLPGLMETVKKAGVLALVGPMTSSVAKAWIPLADQARLLTISPTVTSSDFTGHDDYFFRVISDTRSYARASASHYTERQRWSRFAVVFDETNAAYTRSWLQHFQQAMQERGVALVSASGFGLPQSPSLASLVQQTLTLQPDALVLIANATDSAQMAQLVRKKDPKLPIIATEWSATAQLLLLGGAAVEGLRIAQFMNHQSQQPEYLKFVADFQKRFGRVPGFAEVAAYDAMRVLLEALAQQRPDESIKASLLRIRQFNGLQQSVVFDDFGDSSRQVVMTEVKGGRYQVLGRP
ncbi:MAG: ABC transporter substrate-binding protein [Rhodoferax sp.]